MVESVLDGFESITLKGARGSVFALASVRGRGVSTNGRPVFYLHGEGGLSPDDPFLQMLRKKHRVIAPYLPGFEPNIDTEGKLYDDPRDMLDYTLFGLEALEASSLRDPLVIGHSMGGMIAAEMAAVSPSEVSALALIAPLGLWLDEHPVGDLFSAMPYELPKLLFYDFDDAGPRAERGLVGRNFMSRAGVVGGGMDVGANDPDAFAENLVRNARQMGAAGKLLFPIPDRGLSQRLYRIRAQTSVIWGAEDRLAPCVYGGAFADRISNARLTLVPKAGHMAHWENPGAVMRALL